MTIQKRTGQTNRTVADREKALQPRPAEANATLAAAKRMQAGLGGNDFSCTINRFCHTQIFEFPIDFHPDRDEPHYEVYASASVRACVVSDLTCYFESSTYSNHYAISTSLRHAVRETYEKITLQQNGQAPVFLVIEESSQLTPVAMVNGECCLVDEVIFEDGEEVPMFVGGRVGEKFIIAEATIDGAWPEIPNNQLEVNLVLAGVRAGQRVTDPIPRYVNQSCLVTDDGRWVMMSRLTLSLARLKVARPMDVSDYRNSVADIRQAIAAMTSDIGTPHMALLLNSMYRDEYKDDAYQRLHYLQLWQALQDSARKCLGYKGDIGHDTVIVAGKKTPQELTNYRHDIAHWWIDTIDESFLAELQGTVNELVRQKFF